ncbi:MAG TPA: tetratricopeptide repeat protein [Vicinamibacterales bacterium]|nr:tetratricopeptide repeat protein [Vicinamibacterales bacterium]
MTARTGRRTKTQLRQDRSPDAPPPDAWRADLLWIGLLLATLLAYSPAWHGGLLWDDDAHLTKEALRSWNGLWRIWFDIGATQQYYPVVHSAFWIFQRLWGAETFGYHIVNIVLHATSALVVALIMRRLAIPGAVLAAFLFALHPVHVESVAWMTELKNTLSGVFYLTAMFSLIRFDRTRNWGDYAAGFALYLLALLSKSVTATLPAALLVIFWWQRGRLRWREDVATMLPLFAVGIASGLVTAWVERVQIGAEGAAFDLSLVERTLIAGRAACFYLAKLVWPANLLFVYPRWLVNPAEWWEYLFPVSVVLLLGVLWTRRHNSRAPLAAALFFGGTLFPALGYFNVYPFVFSFVADHFQYLASLGPIALASAALTVAARRRAALRYLAAVVVVVSAVLTWRQAHAYVDAPTLYRVTLERNPDAWMAHVNLGYLNLQAIPAPTGGVDPPEHRAALERAADDFRAAVRLHPNLPQAHNNLGTALMRLGRLDESHAAYLQALRFKPDDPDVRANLALLLDRMGRYEEALPHAREAVRLNARHPGAQTTLGNLLQSLGRFDEAVTAYRAAVAIDPANGELRMNLGTALGRLGRADEATTELTEALRLAPGSVEARRNLGIALLRGGRVTDGLALFREAVTLAPAASTYLDLGLALESAGRYDEALTALKEALRLDPQRDDIRASLARVQRIKR